LAEGIPRHKLIAGTYGRPGVAEVPRKHPPSDPLPVVPSCADFSTRLFRKESFRKSDFEFPLLKRKPSNEKVLPIGETPGRWHSTRWEEICRNSITTGELGTYTPYDGDYPITNGNLSRFH